MALSGFVALLFLFGFSLVAPRLFGEGGVRAEPRWVVSDQIRSDSRLPRLQARLQRSLREASKRLESEFAVRGGGLPVEWRLVDTLPRRNSSEGELGEANVTERGVIVKIPASRFLARPKKVDAVVGHEAAHALLASHLGAKQYLRLPRWFREGFALRVSGEGRSRLAARIATSALEPAKGRFLVGIDKAAKVTPAEGFLALSRLESRGGGESGDAKEFWKRLWKGLRAGRPLTVLLTDTESWASVRARLKRSAEVELRRLASSPSIDDLRRAVALLSQGELKQAEPILDRLVERRSALREAATYFRLRCRLATGDWGRALREAEPLLSGGIESPWEPETLALLAKAGLSHEPERARALARECVERFPSDSATATARSVLKAGER